MDTKQTTTWPPKTKMTSWKITQCLIEDTSTQCLPLVFQQNRSRSPRSDLPNFPSQEEKIRISSGFEFLMEGKTNLEKNVHQFFLTVLESFLNIKETHFDKILLMVQNSETTTWIFFSNPMNNGINYWFSRRISEASTVSLIFLDAIEAS